MLSAAGITKQALEKMPLLRDQDIADTVIYVLSAPHAQVC